MRWARATERTQSGSGPRHPLLVLLLQLLLMFAPWPALAEDARFGEADLQELLQKNPATGLPVDSISELVPLLPRELRANFTFVYDSRSPLRSSISPAYPRVIMFTNAARLVLTFTGDERQPGFDLLESMSFDDESAKFELHSYLLPAAERRGWRPPPEDLNCARCHGSDSRPIFNSYPLWPGFYGSVKDTFPRDRIGAKEERNYAKFLAEAAKTGVYENLIFPADSVGGPYVNPRRFRPHTVIDAKLPHTVIDAKLLPFLPNTRFGMALTELNRRRIYRKLAEGKEFRANEKQLLAKLLECRPGGRPGRTAVRLIEEQLKRENAERLKRLGDPEDPEQSANYMPELLFVRELAEVDQVSARASADRSDWSMALEPGSLAFFDGILGGISRGKSYYLKEDLIFEILAHLRDREPAFRKYFAWKNIFAKDGYPFGNRLNLSKALQSCRLLSPP